MPNTLFYITSLPELGQKGLNKFMGGGVKQFVEKCLQNFAVGKDSLKQKLRILQIYLIYLKRFGSL